MLVYLLDQFLLVMLLHFIKLGRVRGRQADQWNFRSPFGQANFKPNCSMGVEKVLGLLKDPGDCRHRIFVGYSS